VQRDALHAVQTPQSCPLTMWSAGSTAGGDMAHTDEAALALATGHEVVCVEGEVRNKKITTAEDLAMLVSEDMPPNCTRATMETRVGMGYDVHALVAYDAQTPAAQRVITLGGVRIPFDRHLLGHSDADVVLHAVVDALLGALGEGDIGQHFPPSDARWKGADSAQFVAHAVAMLEARGGRVVHMDVTYIGEVPKLSPYRDAMQASLATLLGVAPQRVNVKATTTERMGFTGREEGVAAHAVATLQLPNMF
jgi:2-C-methyl-D-erythritol 4-phosphate cytidylyltransferase / 2-C-methyl-D-erythritol 2,4-cyclodiphosphate synthase